jgi:hypothetical protein
VTPDVSVAAKLASRLGLVAVHLADIYARFVAPIQGLGGLSWSLDPVIVRWNFDEGLLKVVVPFSISVAMVEGDNINKVVEIGTIFRLDYVRPTELQASSDEVSHFAGVHGVMHSWPYFRSEVQALTAKMELPSLTLPPLLSGRLSEFVSVEAMRASSLAPAFANDSSVAEPAPSAPAKPLRKPKRRSRLND